MTRVLVFAHALIFEKFSGIMASSSCEHSRSSPYSEDIRWRIIWQKLALDHKCPEIAQNLNIDISTVKRILQKFEMTGNVTKKNYPTDRASRKITEPVQYFILHLLMRRPGIYLREIKSEVMVNFQLQITVSAVCKFLQKMKFTRQRLTTYAMQRDDNLRQQFVHDVSLYSSDNLLFIDETGTDKTAAVRRIGYSLRGNPVKAQNCLSKGSISQ